MAQNPEMQLVELREYASRRGWHIYGAYTDRTSGAKESRPELDRLLTDARRRRFDIILVWRVDRFGRSVKHLVNMVAELDAFGVQFVSLEEGIDLSTPQGRVMFHVIAAMAQFEREVTQERIRAGLLNAKRNGKKLGRPRIVLAAKKVLKLRAAGLSYRNIGKKLKCSVATVYKVVQEELAANRRAKEIAGKQKK